MSRISFLCLFLTWGIFQSALTQTHQITIRVLEKDSSKPVEGVSISIEEKSYAPSQSDQNGLVYFQNVNKGRIFVSTFHSRYFSSNERLNVSGIRKDDNFTLYLTRIPQDEFILYGEVTDEKKNDLEGATVEIKIADKLLKDTTDQSGNFSFRIKEKEIMFNEINIEVKYKDCIKYSKVEKIPRNGFFGLNIEINCFGTPGILLIENEIFKNNSILLALIMGIEYDKPLTLQTHSPKNSGELEITFQQRAHTHHQEYKNRLATNLTMFPITNTSYILHQINIKDEKLQYNLHQIHEKQSESRGAFQSLIDQLTHVLSLQKGDTETAGDFLFHYKVKLIDAKIALIDALSYTALIVKGEEMLGFLKTQIAQLNIQVQASDGQAIFAELRKEIITLLKEKQQIMEEHYNLSKKPKIDKDCQRIIKDTHLIWLRKQNGWGDTLSLQECERIRRNIIDSTLRDYVKLLTKATESYLLADGSTTGYYFKKITALDSVSPSLKKYANLSLTRLNNPEIFEGSLGMYILNLTPGNGFDKAGLKKGDVVYKVNGKIILDPIEISMELRQSDNKSSIVDYYRDNEMRRGVIKKSKQAGAEVSPLVVFYLQQL